MNPWEGGVVPGGRGGGGGMGLMGNLQVPSGGLLRGPHMQGPPMRHPHPHPHMQGPQSSLLGNPEGFCPSMGGPGLLGGRPSTAAILGINQLSQMNSRESKMALNIINNVLGVSIQFKQCLQDHQQCLRGEYSIQITPSKSLTTFMG